MADGGWPRAPPACPPRPVMLGGSGEQSWQRADRLAARLRAFEDECPGGRQLYRRLAALMWGDSESDDDSARSGARRRVRQRTASAATANADSATRASAAASATASAASAIAA
eukprot:5342666-Pyramimonas_sp.AAC.1